MRGSYFWLIVAPSLVMPPVFLLVAVGSCGIGHGDCRAAVLIPFLYPHATLSGLALGEKNVGLIVFVAIVQFPAYATVLATVWKKG